MSTPVLITHPLDPKVDAYIAKLEPFALPIMKHLRQLVHEACPKIVETIKWSRPFFQHGGVIICNMAAFKQHCSFGFWGEEMGALLRDAKVVRAGGMGSLGRITGLKDLPADKLMLEWIKQAAAFVESSQHTSPVAARSRVVKADKPVLVAPEEFTAALQKNKQAAGAFATLSPSCKREYLEWIFEAKRSETRARRIATAVEWIADGRQRNWKYQNC